MVIIYSVNRSCISYYLLVNSRFYAEQEIGFLKIYRSLKANYDKLYQRPWFKPAKLLEAIVEGYSNLREEMYFRKMNAIKK